MRPKRGCAGDRRGGSVGDGGVDATGRDGGRLVVGGAAVRRADGLRRPHAGFFATREAFKRHMPGRLVGVSLTPPGSRHCGWRCRPASNTSGARKRRRTFARRRSVGGDRRDLRRWHGPEGLKRIARGLPERNARRFCGARGNRCATIVLRHNRGGMRYARALMRIARAAGFIFRLVDDGAVASRSMKP